MTSTVYVARVTDRAHDCARLMRDKNVGFVPVVDQDQRPVGVVTDRDLVTRVMAKGLPLDTPLGDVMTKKLVRCSPDEDVRRTGERMVEAGVGRILVVEPSGRCIGVLSLVDIVRVEDASRSGQLLRAISARESQPPPTLG